MRAVGPVIAVMAAVGLTVFAAVRGTWAVGGSDSSCYGLMASAFARGELQPVLPLSILAPWPEAQRTFAPGGFIPSPVRPDAAAPVCAPGFSLLLTPFRWLGGPDGIFLLIPLVAGLLVWFTYLATCDLGGPVAGALASVVVATTPIVLFQAAQPMNDVTTAMLWVGVVVAAGRPAPSRWWLMGVMTGLALLVRPNLAPIGLAVGIWVAVVSRSRAALLRFGLAAAPGVALLALLNALLYGGPLRVGYGNASELFSGSYVATNVLHYGRASLETLTPFPLLALGAPVVVRRSARPLAWLSVSIAAMAIGVYLLYQPFDEWWYLRFLMPAVVLASVLASALTTLALRRSVAVAVVAVVLGVIGVRIAGERQALDVWRLEARFRHTGIAVRDRLSPNSLFFTVWESGTVRYHANREAVLWDALDPRSLETAVSWVTARGYQPYFLLERWEEPAFRRRFAEHTPLGALDWPPRFEIDRQVRIYSPADREAYLAGQPVPTEQIVARKR